MFETYSKKDELNNTVIGWDIQPKISSAIRSDNEEIKEISIHGISNRRRTNILIMLLTNARRHTTNKQMK